MTRPSRPARGLALLAVLWVVAALSLLVHSLVSTVRAEIGISQQYRDELQAQARGDAFILLALQTLHHSGQRSWGQPQNLTVNWEGQTIAVELRPANGWINPNNAPAPLLAELLQHLGELPPAQATELAERMVSTRQASTGAVSSRFDNAADLMRVPGLSVETFAKIQPAIAVAASDSAGKINPLAAPREVLHVLTQGHADRTAALLQAQQRQMVEPSSLTTVDTSFINPALIEQRDSSALRLAVRQGAYLRIWWVQWGTGPGPLPWRVLEQQTLGVQAPQ